MSPLAPVRRARLRVGERRNSLFPKRSSGFSCVQIDSLCKNENAFACSLSVFCVPFLMCPGLY